MLTEIEVQEIFIRLYGDSVRRTSAKDDIGSLERHIQALQEENGELHKLISEYAWILDDVWMCHYGCDGEKPDHASDCPTRQIGDNDE